MESRPRRARDEPAAAARALRAWPLLVVLAGVLAGLGLAVLGPATWRAGCLVIGGALGLGAVLRIALPSREAGLLQVRSKAFDITSAAGVGRRGRRAGGRGADGLA